MLEPHGSCQGEMMYLFYHPSILFISGCDTGYSNEVTMGEGDAVDFHWREVTSSQRKDKDRGGMAEKIWRNHSDPGSTQDGDWI